jgi:hypothetical protein
VTPGGTANGIETEQSVDLGKPVDLEISRAWLVDPAIDREGPGEIVVRG